MPLQSLHVREPASMVDARLPAQAVARRSELLGGPRPSGRSRASRQGVHGRRHRSSAPRMEYRFIHKDGGVVGSGTSGIPSRYRGSPLVVRGLMVDITRQKLAEEHRNEVEARYRALVEHLPAIAYTESVGDRRPVSCSSVRRSARSSASTPRNGSAQPRHGSRRSTPMTGIGCARRTASRMRRSGRSRPNTG